MGREVRRVPANWKHPMAEGATSSSRGLQPMHDKHFDEAFTEWLADFDRVRKGDLTDIERECYPLGLADWLAEDGRPLDPNYYRPWEDGDATWWQVWETVTEGTPVTPPFATADELIAYLAANGDEWDQMHCREPDHKWLWGMEYGKSGWGVKAARSFVMRGSSPSMIISNGKVLSGPEIETALSAPPSAGESK